MPNRITRSSKEKNLVNLSTLDLGKLERTNRKARKTSTMVRGEIRADEEGVLRDDDGQAYNEAGQRLDDQGIVIPEDLIVDDPNIHNLAVPPNAVAAHVDGVARHHQGVARHQLPADVQIRVGQQGQQQPPVAAARQLTLGDYNRPDLFYANRSAIVPPPFQRHDFELNPAYFTLVGQHPFHGFSNEQPMDHIERFEDLVSSIKANGVSDDYLLCKLFPYSLAGEAASWLKQLKPGSLTNWQSIKIAFLNNFYDDGKFEEHRNKLSTFTQGPAEAFKAAWVRFKEYQRDCPHHCFSEVQLIGTFFRGIDWRYQMALDAASNGNFNTKYPIDAVALIENLACSNSTKNADFERKKIAGAITGTQFAKVNAKLDSVHSLLTGKKAVHFAAEVETIEPEEESEEGVFYIDGQGYMKFGPPQGNFSDGVLPGMPDANPKRTCNAILIRDGDDVWEELDTEDELELAAAEPVRTAPYALVFPPTKPVYTPPVPFPRKRRSKQKIQDARCKAIMEKILTSIPKVNPETSSPTLDRYVKRLVNNGICAEEAVLLTKDISLIMLQEAKKERKKRVVVSEHVSSIIQSRMPEKLPDPGSFAEKNHFASRGSF
ncbi:unnamed protein product [Arabidopsis arenosa]|uniref:Retrotransposon gag domain-containing protein n=1 Tax=Arabidopsis arenosa TaxID=38785 RepID=A0A8S1ZYS6_ARAAE|nr:unnamed protein product [Arabidopsis arenosa]